MKGFYMAVFEGTVQEAADYIMENYSDREWDCPTGREDADGIIEVMGGADADVIIEIDGHGNIRCVGDLETFANIVDEDEED